MKFYDYSLSLKPADAAAVARARSASIKDGTAYKVIFQVKPELDMYWWDGCRYDVLSLAKSFVRSKYYCVVFIDSYGHSWSRSEIEKEIY